MPPRLANIAVFLPVVFIKEEAGQLFKDISIAISISLLLYLFISPTVIPVLARRCSFARCGRIRRRRRWGGGTRRGDQDARLGRFTAFRLPACSAFSRAFYKLTLWLTHGLVAADRAIVILIVVALVGSWA